MSNNIRWLHLSDFHIGKDAYAESAMFKYIVEHVRKKVESGFIPDFVFITGDIANKGAAAEYIKFWEEFLTPLDCVIPGDILQRTFTVPGNHDLNREKFKQFDRREFSKLSQPYFDVSAGGLESREMLIERFRGYIDHDITSLAAEFASERGSYVKKITINGNAISVVGVNTAWLSRDAQDERELTLGKPILEAALEETVASDLVIVLGHHPIDWFVREQQRPIKSLLGSYNCLYLHGHLHDAWTEPSYGGGDFYLAIQSGAAFQAREGEKWRNGLVWGEADFSTRKVLLQARQWNVDQQGWTINSDAFHDKHRDGDWWKYSLPSAMEKDTSNVSLESFSPPPGGWEVKKYSDLEQYQKALDTPEALSFFDGSVPSWSIALSSSIPRRDIVSKLVGAFRGSEEFNIPTVALLTAAGCEGKTTALLQAAFEIIKDDSDWSILRRLTDSRPFDIDELLPILSRPGKWLVVLDGADQAAKAVQRLAESKAEIANGKVSFLLACRDSDWLASEADKLSWKDVSNFKHERLFGLSLSDADKIVAAWEAYGDVGLGDLAEIEESLRVERFRKCAKEEAKVSAGAFYGALLTVRHGTDLIAHAKSMLDKLETIKIPSGGTLKDAIAYIAIMHAESQDYLSVPVLAKVLGCDAGKFHATVIRPLGQEAAATSTSTCIYTRHRYIALAILDVLEDDYLENIASLFEKLVSAAITSYNEGVYIKDLHGWRYDLPEHFFLTDRPLLAIEIAKAVCEAEPWNPQAITNLAYLYRKSKDVLHAVELFRQAEIKPEHRAYFIEWSVSEAECRNSAESVVLSSHALSDECATQRLTLDDAKGYLSGVYKNFNKLYNSYVDNTFQDASDAVLSLMVIFSGTKPNADVRAFLKRVANRRAKQYEADDAVRLLLSGARQALSSGVDSRVAAAVDHLELVSYNGLKQLLHNLRSR
ncbi:metallophosphoesterase [Pseudomonas sp. MG-9]|uniref:metallophosphoesterase family protein n=1 Tax=Pseudomonas sp. MG-9 TaxID=2839032 RepID=UPI001C007EEC|nr:metallophosphoesterase [Pseudomonas sp. MG-9]MBT9267704.1 metallophosphoesterase [Pseudomonas sp. MG-9]